MDLSVQLGTVQALPRRSCVLFRSQVIGVQVQIEPVNVEGALMRCKALYWAPVGLRSLELKEFTRAQVMRQNVTTGKIKTAKKDLKHD